MLKSCWRKYRADRLLRIKLALAFFIPGLILHAVMPALLPELVQVWEYSSMFCLLLAYLIAGIPVFLKAWQQLKRGSWMTEFFLMSIATFGALGLRAWPEAAAIMIFYEVGEYAQHVAIERSRNSIAQLMDLAQDICLVEREGSWQEVDTEEVKVGETILIQAGARVPLDVKISQGRGEIDTSALTGEALPVAVEEGDELLSGSLNLHNPLQAVVLKSADDSTLNRIIEMSEEASLRKAETERLVSRLAKYYTPIVVALAVAMFLVPPLILGEPWLKWFERSLNLLVISCPCALVLSVPLSYFAGLGLASTRGILVKGSDALEKLAHIKILVFDKTGTLTTGELRLAKIESFHPGYSEQELLQLATTLEAGSSHLIAKAFRLAVQNSDLENTVELPSLGQISELPGRGLSAEGDNEAFYLGNARLMQDLGLAVPAQPPAYSAIYLACQSSAKPATLLAVFLMADQIKAAAPKVISQLRAQGVETLAMFSGDRPSVVEQEAKKLGLDLWEGGLLPQDKLSRLDALLSTKPKGSSLAFVGDGINDTPALSLADVGIAMGDVGSDAAVEAADMVLMRDELAAIPEALAISRKTNHIVKQNIIFSLGIKILVVVLSFLGWGGMWAAIFADVGVTMLAIANSFRIVVGKNTKISNVSS